MAQTSLLVQNSCVIACGVLLMLVFQFKEQLAHLYNGWILVSNRSSATVASKVPSLLVVVCDWYHIDW